MADYLDLIARLSPTVSADNAKVATELMSLPDGVRGYEDIKLNNVEHYKSEQARLKSQLGL